MITLSTLFPSLASPGAGRWAREMGNSCLALIAVLMFPRYDLSPIIVIPPGGSYVHQVGIRDIQEQRHGSVFTCHDYPVCGPHGHRCVLFRRVFVCTVDVSSAQEVEMATPSDRFACIDWGRTMQGIVPRYLQLDSKADMLWCIRYSAG